MNSVDPSHDNKTAEDRVGQAAGPDRQRLSARRSIGGVARRHVVDAGRSRPACRRNPGLHPRDRRFARPVGWDRDGSTKYLASSPSAAIRPNAPGHARCATGCGAATAGHPVDERSKSHPAVQRRRRCGARNCCLTASLAARCIGVAFNIDNRRAPASASAPARASRRPGW